MVLSAADRSSSDATEQPSGYPSGQASGSTSGWTVGRAPPLGGRCTLASPFVLGGIAEATRPAPCPAMPEGAAFGPGRARPTLVIVLEPGGGLPFVAGAAYRRPAPERRPR